LLFFNFGHSPLSTGVFICQQVSGGGLTVCFQTMMGRVDSLVMNRLNGGRDSGGDRAPNRELTHALALSHQLDFVLDSGHPSSRDEYLICPPAPRLPPVGLPPVDNDDIQDSIVVRTGAGDVLGEGLLFQA